ncbi:heavy-metal-associated domain-containing protein [Flavobacteriaceae bacterium]|nr:heavy-metal-associated domain-containing protein [Flavobacteriaceae bacterium]MDC3354037.1 heavy-metal-associated domain-containing protein [Flavobacteriaceae bacterium]
MKKLIALFMIAFPLGMMAQEKTSKNTKLSFEVSGNCEMCKKRIEKAAFSVKGVKMATWDIPSNIISVIHDPKKAPVEMLQQAIATVGHDTPLVKTEDAVYDKLPMCCLYDRNKIE